MSLETLRTDYGLDSLGDDARAQAPSALLEAWLQQALTAQVIEPNAMVLASVDGEGRPSSRVVLLRGVDARGVRFFTHYDSRKGEQLRHNPHAAALLFWPQLERQVRLEGRVRELPAAESDAYFASRPRDSQLGAWASPQSAVVADRAALARRLAEQQQRFAAEETVPRPPRWGGYLLEPERIEFWQGGKARLHDRIEFVRGEQGSWQGRRLAP